MESGYPNNFLRTFAHYMKPIVADKQKLMFQQPILTKGKENIEGFSFMKKILFLDFDGVLVTDRYRDEQIDVGGILRDSHGAVFDPVCVENLRQIIDSTGADIVVTSTWKMERGLDGIMWMWADRHLPENIMDVTPDIDPIHRGDEIAAWMEKWGEECRYAIIDDCPFLDFFREEQLRHLFKVDERTGIDKSTMRLVIEHLNVQTK